MNSKPHLPPIEIFQTQIRAPPKLVSVKESCERLGIGRTFFYHLKAKKRLATVKLGRRTFVSADVLEAFIASLSDGHSL